MAIRYRTSLLDAQRYFILNVHQYRGTDISGVIYHSLCEEGIPYNGTIDMVRKIEEISAITDYPSRCVERRSFQKKEPSDPQEAMQEIEHQLQCTPSQAAFRIQIRHQYRGSWQGSVEVVEKGTHTEFESFLELMKVIEQNLHAAKEGTLSPDLDIGTHVVNIKGEAFILQLLYKEYGTWQGILSWRSQKQQVHFRSYLELLMLFAEALELAKEKGKVIDFRKAVNHQ